jgi:hypothetical protein
MTALSWDDVGERLYETGVDHGVLYIPTAGVYDEGVAWNGLVTVTESPSGAEATPTYADNIKYLNLISVEEFGGTIEAYTYPDEWAQCDGTATPEAGVTVGQQNRKPFGLCYRTLVGNDTNGTDHGYKLHLVYGALASPSEKAYGTVNDSPEAITFSWEFSTTPVPVPGFKPSATIVIDSTKVGAASLAALEEILYGTVGADPRLPLPQEVFDLIGGSVTEVETVPPTYDAGTDMITIPTVTGVNYYINNTLVPAGPYGPITEDTVVTARPAAGYSFTATSDDDWTVNFA